MQENPLQQLKDLLAGYGRFIDGNRVRFDVTSKDCIDNTVPAAPGVYWIESTMPIDSMCDAITHVLGHEKKTRQKPPSQTKIITQTDDEFYVVYSGTEDNIRKRLKQHLFNEGHSATAKLGCVIDKAPFSKYQWRASFAVIDSAEIRYAIETWWRLNVGWPVFCMR